MNDLDVMLEQFGWVTVEDVRSDGTVDRYTVRDVAEFRGRQDGKIHRHKVMSPSGDLLYERTPMGEVIFGEEGQKAKWNRKRRVAEKAGGTALTGFQMFAEAWRKALRFWFK